MAKRVAVSTVLGVVCGIICMILAKFAGGAELTAKFVASGMLNRTLMGFVIGSTAFSFNPALRGGMFGLLVSLPKAIPMESNAGPFLVAGIIYGVLIDLLATKAFKANVGS